MSKLLGKKLIEKLQLEQTEWELEIESIHKKINNQKERIHRAENGQCDIGECGPYFYETNCSNNNDIKNMQCSKCKHIVFKFGKLITDEKITYRIFEKLVNNIYIQKSSITE